MYILDTNVVIYFLDSSLPPAAMQFIKNVVDEQSNISVITKMEALSFNFKTTGEQNVMELFINGSNVIDISNDIVNKTIEIRKNKKISLPDAIIAATSLVYDLELITRNTSDFTNISGLRITDLNAL